MKKLGWMFIALLAAAPLDGRANSEELKEADVPRPVLEAFKKEYPNGKATSYEREQEEKGVVYEIKLTADGKNLQVEFDAAGKLLEKEEVLLSLEEAPPAVKSAFQGSKYSGWTIKKVKHVMVPKPEGYSIGLFNGSAKVKLLFDAQGKLLKEKVK